MDTPATALARRQALDQIIATTALAGQAMSCHPALLPTPSNAPDPASWAQSLHQRGHAMARGLDPLGVPPAQLEALRRASVPLAPDGGLRWGDDVIEDSGAALPRLAGEQLLVPPPAVLGSLTSLQLKPVRAWIRQRLGVRLQAAPQLDLYLWPGQAVVISHHDLLIGGFLHGPAHGQRHSLAVEPYGWQVVRF